MHRSHSSVVQLLALASGIARWVKLTEVTQELGTLVIALKHNG